MIRGSARRPGWCPQAGVVSLDSNQRVAFFRFSGTPFAHFIVESKEVSTKGKEALSTAPDALVLSTR